MKGRGEFLKRAVNFFAMQTYLNTQLLVVANSLDDLPEHMLGDLEELSNQRLHLRRVSASVLVVNGNKNIGEKRNIGCGESEGDLIAIWDDDDWSAPGRLESQVKELGITRKAVTGYSSLKFTDGSAWWSFQLPRGLVHGGSMMFRREWWETHRYAEIQIGEDAGFSAVASQANQLAEVPDLNLMYATIHSGNTSKRRPDQDAGWRALLGFQWK